MSINLSIVFDDSSTRCKKITIISFFERRILLSVFLNTQMGRVFELNYAIVVNELNVSAILRSLIIFIVKIKDLKSHYL